MPGRHCESQKKFDGFSSAANFFSGSRRSSLASICISLHAWCLWWHRRRRRHRIDSTRQIRPTTTNNPDGRQVNSWHLWPPRRRAAFLQAGPADSRNSFDAHSGLKARNSFAPLQQRQPPRARRGLPPPTTERELFPVRRRRRARNKCRPVWAHSPSPLQQVSVNRFACCFLSARPVCVARVLCEQRGLCEIVNVVSANQLSGAHEGRHHRRRRRRRRTRGGPTIRPQLVNLVAVLVVLVVSAVECRKVGESDDDDEAGRKRASCCCRRKVRASYSNIAGHPLRYGFGGGS